MNGPASPRWKSATIAIAVAAATATLLAVVPATAGGIINAQRLSGRPGVGCTASHEDRAGAYVATCASGMNKGFLPNDIIRRAPDAAKLGGRPATAYYAQGSHASIGSALEVSLSGTTQVVACCATVQVQKAGTMVLASATVELYTKSAVASQANCSLGHRAQGESGFVSFAHTAWAQFPAANSWDVALGLSSGFVGSPGVWDIAVLCTEDTGDVAFYSGDIIAWTVPNPGPA